MYTQEHTLIRLTEKKSVCKAGSGGHRRGEWGHGDQSKDFKAICKGETTQR